MDNKVIAVEDHIIDLEGIKYIFKQAYGTNNTRFSFYWERTSMSIDVDNTRATTLNQLLIDIMNPIRPVGQPRY